MMISLARQRNLLGVAAHDMDGRFAISLFSNDYGDAS